MGKSKGLATAPVPARPDARGPLGPLKPVHPSTGGQRAQAIWPRAPWGLAPSTHAHDELAALLPSFEGLEGGAGIG
jgi:hypothetical protein